MSELDQIWCAIRDTQERCAELEKRTSLLENEDPDLQVTLEDWPDMGEGIDCYNVDDLNAIPEDWTDEEEAAFQAQQKEVPRGTDA